MTMNRNLKITHKRGQSKGEVDGLFWEIGEPSARQLLWWEIKFYRKVVATGYASNRAQAFKRMESWLNR